MLAASAMSSNYTHANVAHYLNMKGIATVLVEHSRPTPSPIDYMPNIPKPVCRSTTPKDYISRRKRTAFQVVGNVSSHCWHPSFHCVVNVVRALIESYQKSWVIVRFHQATSPSVASLLACPLDQPLQYGIEIGLFLRANAIAAYFTVRNLLQV